MSPPHIVILIPFVNFLSLFEQNDYRIGKHTKQSHFVNLNMDGILVADGLLNIKNLNYPLALLYLLF